MTPDLDTLVERLRTGGWTFVLHADCSDKGLWFYRSQLDPRVQVCRTVPRRSSKAATAVFSFSDAGVDVEGASPLLIMDDQARMFPNIRELVAAIAAHDRELNEERAWQAAAPEGARP